MSFGFGSSTGLSFADLASSNSGDFAFGSKGKIRRSGFNDCITEICTPGGSKTFVTHLAICFPSPALQLSSVVIKEGLLFYCYFCYY